MPAPKNPNTTAATAAVRRRGQETMAAKLRAAGWTVTQPEHRNADSVSICYCDGAGRHIRGENCVARPA